MLKFLTRMFLPGHLKTYCNLSDNRVESEHYEIRKLVDVEVDAVLSIKGSNILVVQGSVPIVEEGMPGPYYRKWLWRVDDRGEVIDDMERPGYMYSSGLCLMEDGYSDWILTGDRGKKPYSEVIDASGMSQQELFRHLDDADIVEFDAIKDEHRNAHDACYLKSAERMIVLQLGEVSERVDIHCDTPGVIKGEFENIGWRHTCLEGYKKKYRDRLSVLQARGFDLLHEESPDTAHIDGFARDFYEFEEGFFAWVFGNILGRTILRHLPGSPPASYWFGDGYFRLTHNSEQLPFKAFTSNEDSSLDIHNVQIYGLSQPLSGGMLLIRFSYRRKSYIKNEKRLNRHYEKDVGLYAVRRKTNGNKQD